MGIVHRPATAYGQELRKWEQHHTQYSIDGDGNSVPGNPYRFRQYPRMLYRAKQWRSGQMVLAAPNPPRYDYQDDINWGRAIDEAESFTRGCQKTVNDESEERVALGQGWCLTPEDALELAKKESWDLAQIAANEAFKAERMTEKARQEYEAAQDAGGIEHVPDVPAPKKRGRPTKVVTAESLKTPIGVDKE